MASKKNPANKAAAAGAVAAAAGRAATKPKPQPAATGPTKGRPSSTVTAVPAKPTDPAPTAPTPVNPFLTSTDFDAISAFYTDLNTKLAAIGAEAGTFDPATGTWSGGTAEANTKYQVTQTDNAAKQNNGAAQDDAAARGIFRSSIKDATLYDIEAQRSLSDKFLNDQLTATRLTAGTNMQILANSKSEFDKNYGSVDANGNPIFGRRAFENAQGVNDVNNSGFSTALATWQQAHPGQTPPASLPGAAPTVASATKGVPRPLTTPPAPAKGTSGTVTAPAQSPNTAQAAAQAFAKRQQKKKYYG